MKKALKIFSLCVTVVKILGGDLSEIAEIPRKVINIYAPVRDKIRTKRVDWCPQYNTPE